MEPDNRSAAMRPSLRIALPIGLLAVLLVAWELIVHATGTAGLVPSPVNVARTGTALIADGTAIRALAGSLQRVLIGFSIAAAVGIPLGLAVGATPVLDRTIRPVLDALRSIAPIAWIPMAILWLGVRGDAALFVVAYAAVFPFLVNAGEAARRVDGNLLAAARSLGAGRALVMGAVIAPSTLPFLFTGARIAMGFAWGSIIAAELAIGIKVTGQSRSVAGLGQLMVETLYVRRDIDALVFFMLLIGVVSFLIDFGMRRAQTRMMPWIVR
jgi:ABC-type nitrate/sulfonate/bicarbonate transport system permease component